MGDALLVLSLLWIPATLAAAAAQTVRNATQRGLVASLGTLGATLVRFLYGLPFAVLILALVAAWAGAPPPLPGVRALALGALGGLAQLLATALMLRAMATRSFPVATALIKTEPVLTAIIGFLVIADPLTPLAVAGIVLATAGVLVVSRRPGERWRGAAVPAFLGVSAGGFFGLAAVLFRAAILDLPEGDVLTRAATVVVIGQAAPALVLLAWLLLREPGAVAGSLRLWRPSLLVGCLGAVASLFWFIGFALTAAAHVRTLALVEVPMAMVLSGRLFRERLSGREVWGLAVMLLGVALVLWSAVG